MGSFPFVKAVDAQSAFKIKTLRNLCSEPATWSRSSSVISGDTKRCVTLEELNFSRHWPPRYDIIYERVIRVII